MFYGSSCQFRAALYIRTIGFRIVFRVIFFPLLLIDIVVLCANFVSITLHLFLPFVSVTFRLFSIFWLCHTPLVSVTFHRFTLFHYFFGVIYVPYFLPFLDVFCVSYAAACFDRFPSFGVIFVAFVFHSFLFFGVRFLPLFCC